MKPDEKYMSEVKYNNLFKFTPPSFDRNLLIDDYANDNDDDNEFLNLYPNETTEDQLYCYYNSLGGCINEKNTHISSNRTPETFEVLRGLDLDIDETTDLNNNYTRNIVSKIYSDIINKNHGISDTFNLYGIPSPIQKVITKRLIKLSLLYNNNNKE